MAQERKSPQLIRGLKIAHAQVSRGAAFVLFAVGLSMYARSQRKIDLDQVVNQSLQGERDCTKEDWQFAFLAQSSGLLKSESLPTSDCKAFALPWLPSAKIVHVTGFAHHDVFVSLAVLRATETSPQRLIKVLRGMNAEKNLENDESNKATFNDLLAISSFRPSEDEMLELGELYLFLSGYPPDERPHTTRELMMVNDVLGYVSHEGGWTMVTVHQRKSGPADYRGEWVLGFADKGTHLQLVTVQAERSYL